MKSDVVFALENAAWPALLIDSESTVCRANQAAIKLFGAGLEGGSALLSAIWSAENTGSAEQFLAHWERTPTPRVSIKLRSKGGNSASWIASVCSFIKDEQRYFVVQLQGMEAIVPPKNSGTDLTLGQKQKLDCALQLTRTVSLDFNNAL